MRLVETGILGTIIIGGIFLLVLSSTEGYKQNNAMIVARSIDIYSSISGDVVDKPASIGASFSLNDLLIKIRNNRVDQGRLTELKTKVEYLKQEITNAQNKQQKLQQLLTGLQDQFVAYKKWLKQDLELKSKVKKHELDVAKKQKKLKTQDLTHSQSLLNKKVISTASLDSAKTLVEIAETRRQVIAADLQRLQFLQQSLSAGQVFFENGNVSYWQENINSIKLNLIDTQSHINELKSQLQQYSEQMRVEHERLDTDFAEEHRAPFSGVVNALYVTKGAHINSGALLMQLLDCSNPVVIVPIPELKSGEFSVGEKVKISPVNSNRTYSGVIKYISSGPLINLDKSIALRQELTAKGMYAVIIFDSGIQAETIGETCDAERRAVVLIPRRLPFSVSSFLGRWF